MHPVKEKILNQAVKSFTEKGFRKVTLDHIAYELGISKKTLYKFYRSKEELIKAVINSIEQRILQNDRAIMMDDNISWEDKIFRIVFAPQGIRRPGNIILEELIHYYPEDFNRLSSVKKNIIYELLVREIQHGAIRSDIDPQIVIMIFMNMLEHLVIEEEEYLYKNKLNLADTLELVGDIILNGIKTKG
ncbi:MAG: TetR/AcrR family transcriptional regulator [Peptococcaceae bacterium]|nr:TetR/AcrR family transcriptional regulator [Peptococcaceae bacterium]